MAARMRSESAQRVSGCVTALLREQPFFGSLALRLPVRPDAGRETLASDGREIRYSPQWIAETDAHVIETAIARVVLACALKHHTRRGERDPERWQRASQLVTHGLLRDAGFTLPPDAEAWDGISVEQAYDRLPAPEPDAPGNGGSPPSGGAGASGDDAAPSGPDDSDDRDGAPNTQNDGSAGNDDSSDGPEQPDGASPDRSGSGAPPSCDPSGTGEVMDAPAGGENDDASAPSPSVVAAEEQAWDEAMHQALNLAKAQGKTPGAVEETIRSAHAGMLDWRALLRRYMTDAAKSDYSWSVPNRRFIDSGLYLPSIRSEGMDAIAVIVDTSGSVDTDALAAFWSEVREVAAEIRPERVVVLQVDAAVQDASEYAPDDLPGEIAVRGRGGTDFRPGFAWLDKQDVRPAVCLYFTDLECDRYPEAEPGFPVLWCDWRPGAGHLDAPPPWGERIAIA
ncbi:MAG: VWA-like domain-containing protein [Rhodospirillaceae bacterium]|nr:VWA-like domain-containing protein [Rhodospirillaceae bacterium]